MTEVLREKDSGVYVQSSTMTLNEFLDKRLAECAILKIQLENRLKLGAACQNFDTVFASNVGTPIQHKNLFRRHFKPLLVKAMLPDIRLYDLRHITVTLLLSAGINPKIVSERLGHAFIVLTLDTYSHVLPTMQREATNELEAICLKKNGTK
ncbi:MAG: Integrase [uncultured Pyrinomonadaceae bacterium]|uniref:Integrase n=1 Tax=uncultured Pyrinomonadaceae bacterium TaxID=2283094 RepID=A0A6J4PPB9_9BACT|nr:MAG: Integrase [uncultured Pyrinomonadaceae bacterium]